MKPLYRRGCPFGQWSACVLTHTLCAHCGLGFETFRDGPRSISTLALVGRESSFNPHQCVETPMATNLVSLIMNFLTPDMIGRIASALGLNKNDTSSAIEAGVPGLLAALAGVATRPGGPQRLADAAKQEVGTLDKFSSMLGSTGQNSLVDRGTQMLSSLLGDRDQAALASAIGKYSGVGSAAGSSLLAGLGPLVMGAIAHQQGP